MYGDYPDLTSVKKILVIKMRHHGDVLLTSPVFALLKKNIPDAQVDAFIYKDTLPMLEGHSSIHQFHLYDRAWKKLSFLKKLSQEVRILRKIRKEKYDLVLNLTEGDRGAIAALVSRARVRVGFDPENKGFKGKKKIYTHRVKNCKTARHTVEKQIDVLRRIGIFPSIEERDLSLHIPEEARISVRNQLDVKTGYIVIHPVSRWRFKCLPPKKIGELIVALHARGFPIVLSASPDPDELAMCEEILKAAPGIAVCNLGGKITLKELAALIEGSRCLICVDSVPLHIASATKTPLIALFGPTSDQNWGPWMHPKSRVVAQKTSCRPCFMDGCGGSKMSDCLFTLPISSILSAMEAVDYS
jgi:heptosyltransferase-3